METDSPTVDIHVTTWPEPSPSDFSSTGTITLHTEFEEFLIRGNYHNDVEKLGTYTNYDSHPDSIFDLKFENFEPNYIYQLLQDQFHDHVLSKQISNQIVDKTQQQRRSPLIVSVSVKLTQKVYNFVPCYDLPQSLRDLEKENDEEEEELGTCSICLENLESEVKPLCQLPYCFHWFHEDCVAEWMNRSNNSCPLCRQPINEE